MKHHVSMLDGLQGTSCQPQGATMEVLPSAPPIPTTYMLGFLNLGVLTNTRAMHGESKQVEYNKGTHACALGNIPWPWVTALMEA